MHPIISLLGQIGGGWNPDSPKFDLKKYGGNKGDWLIESSDLLLMVQKSQTTTWDV